jgi:predicted RNA-binding protein with PUA-like domain
MVSRRSSLIMEFPRKLTNNVPAEVTAFDPSHPYYDAKSDPEHPKWDLVHVEFRRKFDSLIGLAELKSYGKPGGALENLQTLKQTRLSVSAVTAKEWKFIMSLVGDD